MRTFGRGLRVIQSYRQSDSDPLEPEELASALKVMVGAGLTEYDTARSYGKEHIIGAAVASLPPELSAQLTISTKTSPTNPDGGGRGGFSRAAVLRQGDMSREQLQRKQVLVCYLHSPDVETDLDETLAAMDDLYRQGFFQEFGVSNFPAWQVMQIWMKCKERGFCLPRVYQGVYNPIARQVEADILPCCRMLGMRFNAWVAPPSPPLRPPPSTASRNREHHGTVWLSCAGTLRGQLACCSSRGRTAPRLSCAGRSAGGTTGARTPAWAWTATARQLRSRGPWPPSPQRCAGSTLPAGRRGFRSRRQPLAGTSTTLNSRQGTA